MAVLLSLPVPGLGLLYNGRIRSGLFHYLLIHGLILGALVGNLFLRYGGVVGGMLIIVGWLSCLVDSGYSASQLKASFTPRLYNRGWVYLTVLFVHFAIAGLLSTQDRIHIGDVIQRVTHRAQYRIPYNSMKPGIVAGDYVVVDLDYYHRQRPRRGEIIVYSVVDADVEGKYVKRVIALPGEKIEIRGQTILIDDMKLRDPWGMFVFPPWIHRDGFGPLTIPAQHYFVIGDNRDNSKDSRSTGPVPFTSIAGKVLYVSWSSHPDRIGLELGSVP